MCLFVVVEGVRAILIGMKRNSTHPVLQVAFYLSLRMAMIVEMEVVMEMIVTMKAIMEMILSIEEVIEMMVRTEMVENLLPGTGMKVIAEVMIRMNGTAIRGWKENSSTPSGKWRLKRIMPK